MLCQPNLVYVENSNRTLDLAACSAVPQPSALSHSPDRCVEIETYVRCMQYEVSCSYTCISCSLVRVRCVSSQYFNIRYIKLGHTATRK